MLRILTVTLLIVSLFCTCGREDLEDYDANFTGTWHNKYPMYSSPGNPVTNYMRIDGENSEIKMRCDAGDNCYTKVDGKVLISKDKSEMLFRNPTGGMKMRFHINTFPFQSWNGSWECVIENVAMVRD